MPAVDLIFYGLTFNQVSPAAVRILLDSRPVEVRGPVSPTFRHLAMPESRPSACTFHGCLQRGTTVATRWAPAHTPSLGARPGPMQNA